MRVKHWLIGCAICFAGIGGAAATNVDSRELDGSLHGNSDASGARDSGNSSEPGSVGEPGMARDSAQHNGSNTRKGASTPSSSASDRPGVDAMSPMRTPQTHLGWQSLLPGSIQ